MDSGIRDDKVGFILERTSVKCRYVAFTGKVYVVTLNCTFMAAMSVCCAQFAREKNGLPRCVATNVLWRLKVCIFVSFLSVTVFIIVTLFVSRTRTVNQTKDGDNFSV